MNVQIGCQLLVGNLLGQKSKKTMVNLIVFAKIGLQRYTLASVKQNFNIQKCQITASIAQKAMGCFLGICQKIK